MKKDIDSFPFLEKRLVDVHVISGKGEAKYWFEPQIELSKNSKYSSKQPGEIETLIEEHKNEFIAAWKQHF